MKTIRTLVSVTIIAAFISGSAFAQQPANDKQPVGKEQPAKAENKALAPKEEWLRHYNELKPRMDNYLAKVKEEGTQHPEFTEEVKKLDQMMTDFRGKIDNWETATLEERTNWEATMKQYYKRIQDQEARVKAIWEKIHPEIQKKEGTQQK